jgi:hypothetical protein
MQVAGERGAGGGACESPGHHRLLTVSFNLLLTKREGGRMGGRKGGWQGGRADEKLITVTNEERVREGIDLCSLSLTLFYHFFYFLSVYLFR